jgi:hypothetical protein
MKTFTRAGRSTCEKGRTRFRFTNDVNRETVLVKAGHTNIEFWELGSAMTKEQAIEFLVAKGLAEDKPAAKQTAPVRKPAPNLAKLNKGKVAYDEQSASFEKILTELRRGFPSHTEQQIQEIAHFQAQCNQKTFGALEPDF